MSEIGITRNHPIPLSKRKQGLSIRQTYDFRSMTDRRTDKRTDGPRCNDAIKRNSGVIGSDSGIGMSE